MESEPRPEPVHDEILRHDDFLRALARRLVSDEHLANDVVQDTLLAALSRPPRSPTKVRAWLARVIHNRVIQTIRSRVRREQRELAGARQEGSSSPIDELETSTMRRLVIETLLALDEPYKTVLVLRFYEGLEPREISARIGVPVETVRTRVRRGLAIVRGRLERECGELGDWNRALVEFANRPRGPSPPSSCRIAAPHRPLPIVRLRA